MTFVLGVVSTSTLWIIPVKNNVLLNNIVNIVQYSKYNS